MTTNLTQKLKERLELFDERTEDLFEELRENMSNQENHIASMITGEMDGLRWAQERLSPIHSALIECVQAFDLACSRHHMDCDKECVGMCPVRIKNEVLNKLREVLK